MTEIKEILLRIKRGESVRRVSRTLTIHRETINKYIIPCFKLGVDPKADVITDGLIEKIKGKLIPGNKIPCIPRYEILFPVKDRIGCYRGKGLKGSKIMTLLARNRIEVSKPNFYWFINLKV